MAKCKIGTVKQLLSASDVIADGLRAELKKAFSVLESYGVPRERAKTVANGIDVLITRIDKERRGYAYEIQTLEAQLKEVRETLFGIANAEYRKWDKGLDNPQSFVDWAKSRARAALSVHKAKGEEAIQEVSLTFKELESKILDKRRNRYVSEYIQVAIIIVREIFDDRRLADARP